MEQIIALAGNPNVGKSTLFNRLTGMHQHTGNWVGKTVATAKGRCGAYTLVDLPGTYSLRPRSVEEQVARDYLCSGEPAAVIVVCDAGCLARNLLLALQCRALCGRVLVCVNLLDEAERRGIRVDCPALSAALGLPVVGVVARQREAKAKVLRALDALMAAPAAPCPADEERDGSTEGDRAEDLTSALLRQAEAAARAAVRGAGEGYGKRDQRLDRLFTGRLLAFPMMLALLFLVLFLTVRGANLPSAWLGTALTDLGELLRRGLTALNAPAWLTGLLLDGAYRSLSLVVSVMLPPMAIFFPLFTLLEDAGYLPRVAYNLDRPFQRCQACGKQSLCMLMGLGCNAVGVTGCRIIDSRRERLLAVLTNALMPCNGRFPLLIALLTLFFAPRDGASLLPALLLTGVIAGSVIATFGATRLLSATVLKGQPSAFVLELPPYRRPQVGKVLLRSLLDRTLFVLGRAAAVAAPAGAVLWGLANIRIQGESLLTLCAAALDPAGRFFGLDGAILLAFLLGLPANETVLPVLLMIYTAGGTLTEPGTLQELHAVLLQNGWTGLTAACAVIFTVLHWPCSTTLLTVKKETGSWKWTALAALVPTALGLALCALIAAVGRIT